MHAWVRAFVRARACVRLPARTRGAMGKPENPAEPVSEKLQESHRNPQGSREPTRGPPPACACMGACRPAQTPHAGSG
eukprot:13599871-Alexandrium_andersonii.AAC.1